MGMEGRSPERKAIGKQEATLRSVWETRCGKLRKIRIHRPTPVTSLMHSQGSLTLGPRMAVFTAEADTLSSNSQSKPIRPERAVLAA